MNTDEIFEDPNKARSYIGRTFVVNDHSNQEPFAPRCCFQMTRNVAFAFARRAGDKVNTDNWTTEFAKLVLTGPEVKDEDASRGKFYDDEIYVWVPLDHPEDDYKEDGFG